MHIPVQFLEDTELEDWRDWRHWRGKFDGRLWYFGAARCNERVELSGATRERVLFQSRNRAVKMGFRSGGVRVREWYPGEAAGEWYPGAAAGEWYSGAAV